MSRYPEIFIEVADRDGTMRAKYRYLAVAYNSMGEYKRGYHNKPTEGEIKKLKEDFLDYIQGYCCYLDNYTKDDIR